MEYTEEQQKLMLQVKQDIKDRLLDLFTPSLNCGHDWSTGEYVRHSREFVEEMRKLRDAISNGIDNSCKFSFEFSI